MYSRSVFRVYLVAASADMVGYVQRLMEHNGPSVSAGSGAAERASSGPNTAF